MTLVLEAEAATGFTAGVGVVPVALSALRRRMLDVCDSLAADQWQLQSRCELWSVHDVVRHVRDACALHVASLNGEPTPFARGDRFDPRETPARWLDRTAGQGPADTVADLRQCCAREELALRAGLDQGRDDAVQAPYGQVHWTVLATHVFWDAWLHARDVTEVLHCGPPSTPAEDELVALYGLLIASVPALRMNHHFDLTVALACGDGRRYLASVAPGRVGLDTTEVAEEYDLHGELAPVVDALAGRGPELESVLPGNRTVLEPLTWLRNFLAPVAS